VYGDKMSRGEFLRRVLGMGGVATAALVLLTACGGEEDEEEEDDD
jgi:hypothetical protein